MDIMQEYREICEYKMGRLCHGACPASTLCVDCEKDSDDYKIRFLSNFMSGGISSFGIKYRPSDEELLMLILDYPNMVKIYLENIK